MPSARESVDSMTCVMQLSMRLYSRLNLKMKSLNVSTLLMVLNLRASNMCPTSLILNRSMKIPSIVLLSLWISTKVKCHEYVLLPSMHVNSVPFVMHTEDVREIMGQPSIQVTLLSYNILAPCRLLRREREDWTRAVADMPREPEYPSCSFSDRAAWHTRCCNRVGKLTVGENKPFIQTFK